jgi:uncharacterized protein YjbI with pentapeptide repeats
MNTLPESAWRPRFSVRALLMLTLLLAVALGWRSSVQQAQRQRSALEQQLAEQKVHLEYAERELNRARDDLSDLAQPKQDRSRVLYGAQFEGASLRGVTMSHPGNAFQGTSFRGCDFTGATLEGDVAAFQLARFDDAKLAGAKLIGGNAAFQGATFVNADLTEATLTGGPSSFQTASFENANLKNTRLAGSFQGVNLSGARLAGADLSAIRAEDLDGCYFRDPPTYDEATKFPQGFDPAVKLWRKAAK